MTTEDAKKHHVALVQWAQERVSAGLRVGWVDDDLILRWAMPAPEEDVGVWRIQSNGSEWYAPRVAVREWLAKAAAIAVLE